MSVNSNYGSHIRKYMSELTNEEFDPVSKEREFDIFTDQSMTQKDRADFLVKHNVRLVSKVAKKYTDIAEFDDMMQEGIIGLYKAAERFDHTKDIKFCTFAHWYVVKYIQEYLKRENLSMSSIRNHSTLSFNVTGEASDVSGDGGNGNDRLQLEVVDSIYTEASGGYSDIRDNEVYDLMGIITELVFSSELLTERERMIVSKRFFIEKKMTLKQLGNKLGLSHSMVKCIEDKAIRKLIRHVKSIGLIEEDFNLAL